MQKKNILLVLLLIGAMISATACKVVVLTGSGDVISETRQVGKFDHIELSGSGQVIITQGASESVTIETDDNVMKEVKAVVKNGTLQLGFEGGIGISVVTPTRLIFYVTVINLNELSVSGSGEIEAEVLETDRLKISVSGSGQVQVVNLKVDQLTAFISGSGEINLAGSASGQDIEVSGSGKYIAGDVCSATVKVSISGSGNATVCALETLDSEISGSGSVNYYGKPQVHSSSSGSGTINSLGEK